MNVIWTVSPPTGLEDLCMSVSSGISLWRRNMWIYINVIRTRQTLTSLFQEAQDESHREQQMMDSVTNVQWLKNVLCKWDTTLRNFPVRRPMSSLMIQDTLCQCQHFLWQYHTLLRSYSVLLYSVLLGPWPESWSLQFNRDTESGGKALPPRSKHILSLNSVAPYLVKQCRRAVYICRPHKVVYFSLPVNLLFLCLSSSVKTNSSIFQPCCELALSHLSYCTAAWMIHN